MRLLDVVIVIVALSAATAACRDRRQQATAYNNSIVEEQEKIVRDMKTLSAAFASGDTEAMEAGRAALLATIDGAIERTSALDPFEGGTELRDSAKRLFEFYRQVCEKDYADIIDVYGKKERTQEDVDMVASINERIASDEKQLSDAFLSAQESFARAQGITLVENPAAVPAPAP
jgi:hypothetical protein